jgi:hypothetical protein
MLARRLLLLAAVLLLLTALAAGLAPDPEGEPLPPPRATGTVETVDASMDAGATDQSVRASVGDLIRLEVAGDVLDAVEIEQLDRIDAIEPVTPARFEVIAEQAGVFPVRLIEADRRIGRLDISP